MEEDGQLKSVTINGEALPPSPWQETPAPGPSPPPPNAVLSQFLWGRGGMVATGPTGGISEACKGARN